MSSNAPSTADDISPPLPLHVSREMSTLSEQNGSTAESHPDQLNGVDAAPRSHADTSTEAGPTVKEDPEAQELEKLKVTSVKGDKAPSKDTAEGTPAPKSSRSRRPSNAAAQRPQMENATPGVGTRKQANGTIGSVYSGNKIRHLKKEDGVPLWRKDIQYRFLRMVFEDKTPVFTRFQDGEKGLTFADIYIDAMAKSSKTSKILKEKLQTEKPSAIQMAMVCLLVNMGRMNTTLNFFPEMRAQLRTYHPIPSLQAHNDDSSAYKQLQDAPRLKSILKGASEDVEQPGTIDKVKAASIPRSNPVNLIFVLSHYAPKISEIHFPPPRDFFDLVMGANLSSKSRARAFLWLMWFYLESDFSEEAALSNPFGAGLVGEGTDGLHLKVPELEVLTEEEADAENVDTPEEIQFGKEKQEERKRILLDDDVLFRYSKRQKKGTQGYASDDQISEGTPAGKPPLAAREPPTTMFTPLNPPSKRSAVDDDDERAQTPTQTLRSRAKRSKRDSSMNQSAPQRLVLKTRMEQTPDTSSPAPPGFGHPVLHQFTGSPATPGNIPRRPRPLTQHQLALEQNRRERVEYMLAQKRAEVYKGVRARREREPPFFRAGRLLQGLPDGYDTDDENSWGKGGICPNPRVEEDFGETAGHYVSVLRKAARRLQRWDWDAIATREPETWVNQVGRVRPKSEPWANYLEPEVAPEPTPPVVKRGRGGRKKAIDTAPEADKPATGKRGGRVSAVGGRKRGSGEGPGRKSRASGKASKAKLEEDDTHGRTPAVSRAASQPTTQPDEDLDRTDIPDESVMDQDDMDKDILEDEDIEVRSDHPGGVEISTSALAPEEHDHGEEEVEDYASSVYHGAPVEASHADDMGPLSELGSNAGGDGLQSNWTDDETDTAPEGNEDEDEDEDEEGDGDGDGDETMVDA